MDEHGQVYFEEESAISPEDAKRFREAVSEKTGVGHEWFADGLTSGQEMREHYADRERLNAAKREIVENAMESIAELVAEADASGETIKGATS